MNALLHAPKRLRLVLWIREGEWGAASFRVVAAHRTQATARRRAVRMRKRGWLARVKPYGPVWLVAVRKPRKRAPFPQELVTY